MDLSMFLHTHGNKFNMRLNLLSLLLLFSGVRGASSDQRFDNMSVAVTSFDWLLSGSPSVGLKARQELECSVPGGAICDALTCCRPGQHCCPVGCCLLSYNCFGVDRCCPQTAQNCNGIACCAATATCCGTGCCAPGAACERNECIHQSLKDKIVSFELNDKNRQLLINMCNGMQGKNTETLTYRGPDLKERDQTRIEAGCIPGFCAGQIRAGLVDPTYNSCDEFPPASSLEGGRRARAVNCIPSRQNSIQGGKLGGLQSTLRSRGLTFQRGDKFVISIDCDQVLGELHSQKRALEMERRDTNAITMSGNETVDSALVFGQNQTLKYLLIPLGDLESGTYSTHVECLSGSIAGAYVLDSDGYNYTTSDATISTGQTQDYNFTIPYDTTGVGVIIGTTDPSTTVTWKFNGTIGNVTESSTISSGPSSSGPSSSKPSSGAQANSATVMVRVMGMLAAVCFFPLFLQ